jgi:hypothetical protein
MVPDMTQDFKPSQIPYMNPDLIPDMNPDLAPDLISDLIPDLIPDLIADLIHDLHCMHGDRDDHPDLVTNSFHCDWSELEPRPDA